MPKPLYIPATRIFDDPAEFYKFALATSRFTKKISVPKSVSADYTVEAEVYWIRVDASGGAITVTLPPVGEIGRPIGIIKVDSSSNVVTVDGNGSETINGATTRNLTNQYDSVVIIDNGSSWDIEGRFGAVNVVDAASDTTTWVALAGLQTGNQPLRSDAGLTYNASTDELTTGSVNLSNGQAVFPATQNSSSNANTLDDYEEGTWTPVLTCVTPGNLSVAYTTQTGNYQKVGRDVRLSFNIVTSSFTHTTASGNLRITGSPFEVLNVSGDAHIGALYWSGITKANYTNIVCRITAAASNSIINLFGSGSGVAGAQLTITDFPTGGSVTLSGSITYPATT